MSAILKIRPQVSFRYGTFGNVQKKTFTDFNQCVKAAMDAQVPHHDGEDMYIYSGKRIICIITFFGVEYTEAGLQFLQALGLK